MVQTTREIETAMKHLRPTIGQEHYLTGDEICRRFHVCKRTLQTYRDRGLLPYSQINHKIYYRTEDVEVFVESMSREIMEDE